MQHGQRNYDRTNKSAFLLKLTAEQDAVIVGAINSHHATERMDERIIVQEFQRSLKSAANRLGFREPREDSGKVHIITTTCHLILTEDMTTVITVFLTKQSFKQWWEIERAQRHLNNVFARTGGCLITKVSGSQKDTKAERKATRKEAQESKKGNGFSYAKFYTEKEEAMTVLRLKKSQKNESIPRPASSVNGILSSQNIELSPQSTNHKDVYEMRQKIQSSPRPATSSIDIISSHNILSSSQSTDLDIKSSPRLVSSTFDMISPQHLSSPPLSTVGMKKCNICTKCTKCFEFIPKGKFIPRWCKPCIKMKKTEIHEKMKLSTKTIDLNRWSFSTLVLYHTELFDASRFNYLCSAISTNSKY